VSTTNFGFAAVWQVLSLSEKGFLLFLSAVFIYTVGATGHALLLLRSAKQRPTNEHEGSVNLQFLFKRVENLKQLHLFTLYLFGFFAFVQLPDAFHTLGSSSSSPLGEITQTLRFMFDYDASIFLFLLFLHTLQWILSVLLSSRTVPLK
jgi:hypothetical protein